MSEPPAPLTLSRRRFLQFSAAGLAITLTGCDKKPGLPRIGLALGGGGAKGLAHILMLEALDDLGIRPHIISGTSIGAIIGALYAAGLSGSNIRALIEQFFVDKTEAENNLFALPKSIRWLDFIDPALAEGGLLDSSDFITWLGEVLPTTRFKQLRIPLKVVTAELSSGRQVVIDSGDLLPALQASMAVPGVFAPVKWKDLTLVDGGVVNPLPYDLVKAGSDLVIAIDASGNRDVENGTTLSSIGVLLQSFHNMGNNIIAEKLKRERPAIYIRPDIRNVKVLEFYKAREIFAESQPAQQQLIKALKKELRGYAGQPG